MHTLRSTAQYTIVACTQSNAQYVFACTQTAQQRQLLAEGLEKNQRLGELVMGLQAALGLECRLPDPDPSLAAIQQQPQQQQTSSSINTATVLQLQQTNSATLLHSPHHQQRISSRLNPVALPTQQQLPPLAEQGALPNIPPLILYGPQGDPMFLAVTSEHPSGSSSPAGAAPPQRHFRLTPLSAHQAHK